MHCKGIGFTAMHVKGINSGPHDIVLNDLDLWQSISGAWFHGNAFSRGISFWECAFEYISSKSLLW